MLQCNAPFCQNTRNKNHAWCSTHRWEREKFNVKPFKQILLFNPKKIYRYKPTKEQNSKYNKNAFHKRRDYKYQKRYGVSFAYYQKLLMIHNNQCAICKSPATPKHPLHLDHCHVTQKIRGVICYKCNVALGYFKDSIPNLVSALRYLRHHYSGEE